MIISLYCFWFFKELKKYAASDQIPSHTELFERLIEKPYQKHKDYLLRNKMGQLNEIIYKYLATDAVKASIATDQNAFDYWLAKAYYDRRLNSLFEKDIDGFVSDAKKGINKSGTNEPTYSGHLFSLKSIWMIHHSPRLSENVKAQMGLLGDWMDEEKRRFLYKIREIESREAFLRSVLGESENTTDWQATDQAISISVIDLSEIQKNDGYARFQLLKKKVYQTIGQNKIDILNEIISICRLNEYKNVLGTKTQSIYRITLARELILMGKFQMANEHFEEILAGPELPQMPQNLTVIQNHIANQINLGRYDKGISIYKQYEKQIRESAHDKTIALHLSYLYLFKQDEEKAMAILPDATSMIKLHQIHHRHAYMIAFIIRGEYRLAETESNNLKRFIKRIIQEDHSYYLKILALFDEYIDALTLKKKDKEYAIKKLKAKYKENYDEWNRIAIDDFPLRWLMRRLSEL